MRTMIQTHGRRPMTPRMTAALPCLCARSDARYFRAFRAESLVWCTLTATGHSSTIGNGSINPVMRLDGPGLST
jgi:hypothetical protein